MLRFRSLLERALTPKKQRRSLRVFDFDDTLADAGSAVAVVRDGKRIRDLSSLSFKDYILKSGEQFDFSNADRIRDPKPIGAVLKILRAVLRQRKDSVILTGRSDPQPVRDWLRSSGIDIPVVAVGGAGSTHHSIAHVKLEWLAGAVQQGHNDIEFLDDNALNIQVSRALKQRFPNIRFKARLVRYKPKGIVEWVDF